MPAAQDSLPPVSASSASEMATDHSQDLNGT